MQKNYRAVMEKLVLFLPPNTTSVVQPLDQGIIVSAKRLYQCRYLQEVMTVVEEGACTQQNIRDYNVKSVIYNFADAWKEVKKATLANSWKKTAVRPGSRCRF